MLLSQLAFCFVYCFFFIESNNVIFFSRIQTSSINRPFYLMIEHLACNGDLGYMMIIDVADVPGACVDAYEPNDPKPYFIVSAGNTDSKAIGN